MDNQSASGCSMKTYQISSRVHKPVEKYVESSLESGFYLLFFKEENLYEVISSNSTLLPNNLSFNEVTENQEIMLKPDILAIVISKSRYMKDMEVYKKRMELKISKGFDVVNDSFSFLNKSINESLLSNLKPICQTDINYEESDDSLSSVDLEMDSQIKNPKKKVESVTKPLPTLDVLLQNDLLKLQLKAQKKILLELKSIKKLLKKEKIIPVADEAIPNHYPVMFNGEDLVLLGERNMEVTKFAICVARKLFTDDELKTHNLFKQRESGRPSLSPCLHILT
ncbi:uncharacterized protein LOC136081118 [Hydra vulgaris]|uniref:Uncharacterized protein LOC136081118 n=1 Tax=Hydra vulgaris TaxID=6087 RepID=A0ABM4BYZ1_HYDVU